MFAGCRGTKTLVFCVLSIAFSVSASAFSEIKFRHKAGAYGVIVVDGKPRVLRPGEVSEEGIKLVSVTAKEAVVEIGGKRYRYRRGSSKGVLLKDEVLISQDPSGSYVVDAKINGKPIKMVVDTGASAVFLSGKDARRLGIRYKKKMYNQFTVITGQGTSTAYGVILKSVSIGDIEVENVDALVSVEKNYPPVPLLGVTFLDRVTFVTKGKKMLITR